MLRKIRKPRCWTIHNNNVHGTSYNTMYYTYDIWLRTQRTEIHFNNIKHFLKKFSYPLKTITCLLTSKTVFVFYPEWSSIVGTHCTDMKIKVHSNKTFKYTHSSFINLSYDHQTYIMIMYTRLNSQLLKSYMWTYSGFKN